jgi:hypothetical protein
VADLAPAYERKINNFVFIYLPYRLTDSLVDQLAERIVD